MLNWFKSLFSSRESYNLDQIGTEEGYRLGLIPQSIDGVLVSEDSILALGTLWRASRVIAEGVGNLPIKIYRKTPDARQEATTHQSWKLVHRRPHPRFSAQDFWTLMTWNAVLYGTAVATIQRDGATATSLTPVHPRFVSYDQQSGDYLIEGVRHDYEDLIVILGPTPCGTLGYRLTRIAREALSFYLSTEAYGSAYFRNMCDTGGFVMCPPGMSPEAKDNVFKSFEERSRGVHKSGSIGMLEDGCDYKATERDHESSQYHETRERNSIEICKFLGVDPFLCFEWGRATWNNSKEGKQNFLTFSLNTYLNKIENELNEKVILPSEQESTYVEFVRSAMIEMDALQQAQIWQIGVTSGWFTADEIRTFQGLPKLPTPTEAVNQSEDDDGKDD